MKSANEDETRNTSKPVRRSYTESYRKKTARSKGFELEAKKQDAEETLSLKKIL